MSLYGNLINNSELSADEVAGNDWEDFDINKLDDKLVDQNIEQNSDIDRNVENNDLNIKEKHNNEKVLKTD